MPIWFRGLLFALAALLVLYGMHRYAWTRLARDTGMAKGWRVALAVSFGLLAACVAVVFVVGRGAPSAEGVGLGWVVWTWLGFLYYCVLLLGLGELVRRAGRRAGGHKVEAVSDPFDPSRRTLLARAVAGGALAGSAVITARGVRSATGEILTPEIPVRLARLPRELDGFRIVLLADLHLGPLLGARFLETVVEKANAQRPDLVVVAGDLVDSTVAALGRELAPLAKLSARHGVAFVTGNHEYYSGVHAWVDFLRAQSWRVLVNERVTIGGPSASFDLAGVPDHGGGTFDRSHAPDLSRALAGRDLERELVLLAHQPRQIEDARGHGVGLQLSGHTHGGQMWPFGTLVGLFQPYVRGLHRHEGQTWIYVSRGTGFWGPPLRVAEPAEIATIVLVA